MTERIGIIGSRTYPTKSDVVEFVSALPIGTVIVSGGAKGPDTWAVETAKSLGLTTIIHWPDLPRYGSPSAFYYRNVRIVEDSDRIVAFAAKDPKTKAITAGTTMTLGIAERSNVPSEIIETPVLAVICVLINRAENYLEKMVEAPTLGEFEARRKVVNRTVEEICVENAKVETRLKDGWDFIDRQDDPTEKERLTDRWLKWLAGYEKTMDVIGEFTLRLSTARERFAA